MDDSVQNAENLVNSRKDEANKEEMSAYLRNNQNNNKQRDVFKWSMADQASCHRNTIPFI